MTTASVPFWSPLVQNPGLPRYKKLYLELPNLPMGRCQSLLHLLVGAGFAINQTHPTEKQKREE